MVTKEDGKPLLHDSIDRFAILEETSRIGAEDLLLGLGVEVLAHGGGHGGSLGVIRKQTQILPGSWRHNPLR